MIYMKPLAYTTKSLGISIKTWLTSPDAETFPLDLGSYSEPSAGTASFSMWCNKKDLFILKWLMTFSNGYGRQHGFILKIITSQMMARTEFVVYYIDHNMCPAESSEDAFDATLFEALTTKTLIQQV